MLKLLQAREYSSWNLFGTRREAEKSEMSLGDYCQTCFRASLHFNNVVHINYFRSKKVTLKFSLMFYMLHVSIFVE